LCTPYGTRRADLTAYAAAYAYLGDPDKIIMGLNCGAAQGDTDVAARALLCIYLEWFARDDLRFQEHARCLGNDDRRSIESKRLLHLLPRSLDVIGVDGFYPLNPEGLDECREVNVDCFLALEGNACAGVILGPGHSRSAVVQDDD
jgi:hypothetical protein